MRSGGSLTSLRFPSTSRVSLDSASRLVRQRALAAVSRIARAYRRSTADRSASSIVVCAYHTSSSPTSASARIRSRYAFALVATEPVGASCNRQACDEPLDIPFPRPAPGLVEVVDVEDQVAFWGSEQAEVGQMGVTAQLRVQ